MKLTVIGEWGGYPAQDGATSSYILEKNGFTMVIDMGSGALAKLQKYKKITDLDAVILSHYHHDHVADIGVLQYARLVQYYLSGFKDVLPIYGHKEDEAGFKSLTDDYTKGVGYDPSQTLQIGPFSITFLRTKHSVPCFGMRISDGENVLIYTADTSYKAEWIDFSTNADVIISDCNFYADQDGTAAGHMNSTEGAKIAAEANAKTLILSHLPQYGNNQQLVQEAKMNFNGDVQLAHSGLIWGK